MNDEPGRIVGPLVDGHSHVASTRFTPLSFLEGVADNIEVKLQASGFPVPRSRIIDQFQRDLCDHQGDAQVAAMDRSGIHRSVLLLPDFTYALPDSELSIEEMFQEHQAILQRHAGRFEVFAGVDPRWGKDGLDLFIRGIETYGFSGLKLYPPCGYQANDPLLEPFYEYCNAHRLPVLLHIGPTSPALSFAHAQARWVDEPARRYRDIPFILAHGAVNDQTQCIELCKYRPNVYLDLSGAQHSIDSRGQAPMLKALFENEINHKIIFGTDWPINNHESINRRLRSFIVDPEHAISDHDASLILSGNMQRLLNGIAPRDR
ncbi:amidohydrolase family protein [Pseudomonas sp. D2-30]